MSLQASRSGARAYRTHLGERRVQHHERVDRGHDSEHVLRTGSLRKTGETRFYDATTARLTARAGGTYSYDRSGNLVSWVSGGTTWTYGYDALERLIWVRQNGALIARYAYDGLGRRLVKRVYSGANAGYLRMLYAGGQVVADADLGLLQTL